MSFDDRITCEQCAGLLDRNPPYHPFHRCLPALRRERLDVAQNYGSIIDLPTRCIWFTPVKEDTDQRTGAERYPVLVAEYEQWLAKARQEKRV